MKRYLLIAAAVMAVTGVVSKQSFSKTKNSKMKLEQSQVAPAFSVKDVNGNLVDLKAYKGRKVLLSFHRFVGCPICNLRFHQLEQQAAAFNLKGLVVIAVYESSNELLKEYVADEHFSTVMIADPEEVLYGLYDIERSKGKLMKGMLHGAIGKAKEGTRLFKKKLKSDGHVDRVGADFLIDEEGKIITAYYGKYVGDALPIDDIKATLE